MHRFKLLTLLFCLSLSLAELVGPGPGKSEKTEDEEDDALTFEVNKEVDSQYPDDPRVKELKAYLEARQAAAETGQKITREFDYFSFCLVLVGSGIK